MHYDHNSIKGRAQEVGADFLFELGNEALDADALTVDHIVLSSVLKLIIVDVPSVGEVFDQAGWRHMGSSFDRPHQPRGERS